jgi:FkbM family methyltransferase
MLVSTLAQPMTPLCNVSLLAGMHSIQLLRQLLDPRRCPGAAARLPTDGTDGGLVIDGGTANDAEDAVHWLRERRDWRAIGFEPNRAECQRASAALAASARGNATMVCRLCRTRGRPRFGQNGAKEASAAAEGAGGVTWERLALASQPLGQSACRAFVRHLTRIPNQVCKALSDRVGSATFAEGGQQGSLVASDGADTGGGSSSASAQTVESTTLDASLPPPLSVFLLKLDLQGGEVKALLGASRLLSDARRAPRYLYIEFDPLLLQRASTSAAVCGRQPPRGLGQFALQHARPAPDQAPGGHPLRPASANKQMSSGWPVVAAPCFWHRRGLTA